MAECDECGNEPQATAELIAFQQEQLNAARDAVEELLHALDYFGGVGPVAQHARELGKAVLAKTQKGGS